MYLQRETIEKITFNKCHCVRTKCRILEPGSNAILNFACLIISSAIIATFVAIFKTKFARVLHAIFANEDGLQWPFDTYCLTLMRDVQKITDNDIKTFF